MEDEFIASENERFIAALDGHGGPSVSRYTKENLLNNFQTLLPEVNNLNVSTITDSIVKAMAKVDEEVLLRDDWAHEGSTAAILYIHSDNDHNDTYIVANAGDSRVVLSRESVAVDLSNDHKPELPAEVKRITENGGFIQWDGLYKKDGTPDLDNGVYRVNGNLSLSRAIGDKYLRPCVSAEPEIRIEQGQSIDDFLIGKCHNTANLSIFLWNTVVVIWVPQLVAPDGLWHVFSSQEAVDIVTRVCKICLKNLCIMSFINCDDMKSDDRLSDEQQRLN
jgi:serine/threonine protein phosphatase PrpC